MEIIIYLIAAVAVIDLIIVFYVFYRKKRRKLTDEQRRELMAHWKKALADTNYNHAVISADKILDRLLNLKGYNGSLGEKMKSANKLFSDPDGIWKAHKLRNKVAHEIGAELRMKDARNALMSYERAFKDLNLL